MIAAATVPPAPSTAVEANCAEPANTNTDIAIAGADTDHGLGEHPEGDRDHEYGDRDRYPGAHARTEARSGFVAHAATDSRPTLPREPVPQVESRSYKSRQRAGNCRPTWPSLA